MGAPARPAELLALPITSIHLGEGPVSTPGTLAWEVGPFAAI